MERKIDTSNRDRRPSGRGRSSNKGTSARFSDTEGSRNNVKPARISRSGQETSSSSSHNTSSRARKTNTTRRNFSNTPRTSGTHRSTNSHAGTFGTRRKDTKPTRSAKTQNLRSSQKRDRNGKGGPRFNFNGENSKKDDVIPALQKDTIRIIPLGGVEEIGRNMTVIEYEDDIIVVDCGFQFQEDTTPGIDFILPNTKYLEDRKDKIRGVVVTHGHLDHIGAFPYVMELIGMPPIYSRRLTTVMIKKRQEEFPNMPKFDIREVETKEKIKLGKLTIRFFAVSHTIPDAMGIIIETPHGSIVHTGDLKVDHVDGVPTKAEEKEFKIFEKENVLMLCADSTNVDRPGFSFPESEVHKNIEGFIKTVPGRLIIGTFASQLERIAKIVEIAEKHKKKIVIEGRSMKTNIEIVRELGILKVEKDTIISTQHIDDYPDNKIIMLATGAQGDEFSALMRIATKSHRNFKIKKNDTVMLSSSVIPGNERPVQKLKDNLSRQGAHIIHYQMAGIHSSGHANKEEARWIHKKIKPKFFMPLHGYHYMLRMHKNIAMEEGLKDTDVIVPDNSSILEIRDRGTKFVRLKEMAPAGLRLVDGFSVGDIQEVLIRDRKVLAQEGMFVIIATINLKTGKLRKSPDIISRGFVYLRESQELLQHTRLIIKKTVEGTTAGMNPINFDYVKANITDDVSRFLFQKTNKRPIVIPVILGV